MFKFFKKIFQHQEPQQPKKPAADKPTKIESTTPAKPVEVFQPTKTNKKVTAPKPQPQKHELANPNAAEVFVALVDENDELIKPKTIIETELGAKVNIQIPTIKDYIFTNVDGLTANVLSKQQVITVHYLKKLGEPVGIYCFDFDSLKLLAKPKFLTGPLQTEYHLEQPEIADYDLHASVGDQTGVFNQIAHNFICYYRRKDWRLVQPVNYLVKTVVPTKIYPEPADENEYEYELPADSTWKVFKEIKTKKITWLSLGGAKWVKQDYVKKVPMQNQID